MSNTEWSLSGVIGEAQAAEGFDNQVMTQGLGFPLRTVEGVPPQDSGEFFNPDTIAPGYAMVWCGGWEEGKIHLEGYVVSDGIWKMLANKPTLEQPFPQTDGNPTYGNATFTPATQADNSEVQSGQLYTFTENVVVRELRVWVPATTASIVYRVTALISTQGEPPRSQTITLDNSALTADGWTTVSLPQVLVTSGSTALVVLSSQNLGATTPVTGGWFFSGTSQSTPPATGEWNTDNQATIVRIDKTDLDSTDRSSELGGFIVGTEIQFVETDNPVNFITYRTIAAPVDNGTYFSYAVIATDQGASVPSVGVTTMNADVPIQQSTDYSEEAGVPTPAWATAQGYLAYDGVEQPAGQTNSYGVDLQCEITTFSEDWIVFSYNAP